MPKFAPARTSSSKGRSAIAIASSVVLVGAMAISPSSAAETDLTDGGSWVTNTASTHAGVEVKQAQLFIRGGDGGNCISDQTGWSSPTPSVNGGSGATVTGVVTFTGTQTLLSKIGINGQDCQSIPTTSPTPTTGGAGDGGTGAYAGGNGANAIAYSGGTFVGLTQGGAGGGGSTAIWLGVESPGNEIILAGGGGGASGSVPRPTTPPEPYEGGAGGDAGQTGQPGLPGQVYLDNPTPSPGQPGSVAATPGLNAADGNCEASFPAYCGGGGGNGGGAAGAAADSGAVSFFGAVAGAGGAGGNSSSTLTDVVYNTSPGTGNGTGQTGHAKILWADIPTGSINDLELGEDFTGDQFTAEGDPATVSNTTWSLLPGAPAGLTIDPATGEIGGTASEAGTFNVEVQATVEAKLGTNPTANLISVKTITVHVTSNVTPTPTPTPSPTPTPTPPIVPPAKPRDAKVVGSPTGNKYKVSWKKPVNRKGNRPTKRYKLTLWQTKSLKPRSKKRVMSTRNLRASTTSITFSRNWLIKHSVRMRGEFGNRGLYYLVRIKAFNSKGGGPATSSRFWIKL